MHVLDVPISMYVVPDFQSLGPKVANVGLVTVPVIPIPSNTILLLHPHLWSAQEQVDMWMQSSSGNMCGDRNATQIIAVRPVLLQEHQ